MRYASRLHRLGTETAFSVALEAKTWENKGHKVYPFHLGDLNLSTPLNIQEAALKHMRDGKTGYCPSEGIPELRDVLSQDVGFRRGVDYTAENVVIQPGGKPTIWKFISAVMDRGDEVLYPNPGYPIYESQIEYQGGIAKPYSYFETDKGFTIDIDQLKASISEKTKALIYNNYQNPTSAASSKDEMEAIAEIAIKHDLWVLADDAYFEIRYDDEPPISIVSIPGMQERTAILYTFSKKYAMTGWRIGGTIGPRKLIHHIAQINLNDESCTNHFLQWAMIDALTGDGNGSSRILSQLKDRRDAAMKSLNSIEGIQVAVPESTFYIFPNVTKLLNRKGILDIEQFRKKALVETGVSFCTRKHFGRSFPGDESHFIRLAYSAIEIDDIHEGLEKFKAWIVS
ncbi:uncharacterized protein METZ01_LOCUS50945 [marine metagenome]|uniref:Aminotransferase class I/classII large domain-containing protein n=1 Tax=marine metagenome TaxID=408172 RepID=A0A381S449_9ZZZZ